jgi:TolB protein
MTGFSHHVYVEGYELPVMMSGPTDPAISPDGQTVAFAARGWLWLFDPESGEARRLTSGGELDARPAWSPDGSTLAFVRDDGTDTWIVLRELASGEEHVAVNEPAIDLDPAFSADGRYLFYASAVAGDLDLWRLDLSTGERARLTDAPGLERSPQPMPDGNRVVYLYKTRRGNDALHLLDIAAATTTTLERGRIASQARAALAPGGHTVAYNWPSEASWDLRLLDVASPGTSLLLSRAGGLPLTPAWSADGAWVWYAEATADETTRLYRIPAGGGEPRAVDVSSWNWGAPPGRLRIRTRIASEGAPAAARLSVVDGNGHPAVPDAGPARFDGQNGRVFLYSPGVIEVTVPAGEVVVSAVQGLATPEAVETVQVRSGETRDVELVLEPVWNARAAGWAAGDHHFHLNYGGPYRLDPGDIIADLRGEAMDVATPLLANLHNRFGDQRLWGWERSGEPPLIAFGQEVRSHFLGHLNLLGIGELYWPWVWGPGYEVYGRDDRTNAEVLGYARSQGGVGGYVHPVVRREPFASEDHRGVPLELIPDAVLGDVDLLEVACLWSDELGTSEVWYRLLNLGRPVAASAGTDVMNDLFRTMAIGTARVYVRVAEHLNLSDYLDGLARGRSFVTTGPLLEFTVADREPGEATDAGLESAEWKLELHSATPVDSVEILVNGQVVLRRAGVESPGSRSYQGTLDLPAGGWVAARAFGGDTTWPVMDSYPFAHTSPIWVGHVGSTEPAAAAQAAGELLLLLDAAEAALEQGYEGTPIPNLEARFSAAREALSAYVGG